MPFHFKVQYAHRNWPHFRAEKLAMAECAAPPAAMYDEWQCFGVTKTSRLLLWVRGTESG